jgi:2-oxoglutarate ferredoxin oxidoreductase subunit gamma
MIKQPPSVKARVFNVLATKTAETQLGNKMQANMVMLGALAKVTKIVTQESVEKALRESIGSQAADKGIAAFRTGLNLI